MYASGGEQFAAAAFRGSSLLFDTCSIINIATRPDSNLIIEHIERALESGVNKLLVPDVVADEFAQNRESTIIERTQNRDRQIQSFRDLSDLHPVQGEVESFIAILRAQAKSARESAVNAVGRINDLLSRGLPSVERLSSSDSHYATVAKRIRFNLRPGQQNKTFQRSAINDHIIWLHVLEHAAKGPILFCSDNHSDFCDKEHDQLGIALQDQLGTIAHRVDFHSLDSFLRTHRDGSGITIHLAHSCPFCGMQDKLIREIRRQNRDVSHEFFRCDSCNATFPSGRANVSG